MDPTATTLWSVTPPADCVPDEVEWRTNRVIELGIRRAWMMVGVLGLTLGVLTGSAEASEAQRRLHVRLPMLFLFRRGPCQTGSRTVSNGSAPASFGC